ncbi:MAG: response regulator [Desulfatibacillaceae bacterium]
MSRELRVLIVDDETAVQESLRDYFEDENVVVFVTHTAERGLEFLNNESVDVAVVDMRLPGMDGQAFILEAAEKHRDLAFVIYTGSTDYVLPESLEKLGMRPEDVFRKPVWDLDLLLTAVREAAERRSGEHE